MAEFPFKISLFGSLKGFFPCRRCKMYMNIRKNTIRTKSFVSHSTSKSYDVDHFGSCNTKRHGLYFTMSKCTTGHSLSKYYCFHHDRDPSSLKLVGIDCYSPRWKESNFIKGILGLETRWIFQLKTYRPHGHNIE